MADLTRDHFDASKWGVRLGLTKEGSDIVQFGGEHFGDVKFVIPKPNWLEMGCPRTITVFIKREPIT